MQIDPNSNPWFTPSAAPQGTSELDHLNKGLYAYVNAAHDPELKKQADTIFGRTVPFDNSETQATLIGRSWCSRSGYLADPVRYCRDNKLPLPPNWSGENAQLYTLIGQNYIGKAQEHFNNQKAAREKALADAQKDYTETMGELPSLLAKSIRSAGGEKGTPLTPQYLEKLTKYGAREGAIQSQQRAATAWMYMSAYMDDIDSMQSTGRDKLLDIANTLSDDKGQLDPHATAAFLMMMEDKATELQSTDSQFWADFADKFQNSLSRSADQIGKAYTNKGKGWNSSIINPSFIVSTNPELDPNWLASQDNEPDPTYNDPRVEQLYGYMQRAINTAIAPSEKAEWYAKLLSEMGGLVGESAIPMALGIAASAATAGAGGGAFLAAAAGYGAGFAATAPSTINASIAEAYAQGKVNPELYGTLEGIGQAAAENIGGPATSLKLFTKTAGKITNWAASRTAGSRFLANQYARTTLNYLTAGAFESLTELGEEELGGYIGSRLNALAREMGATVSPQAYKLGETLSNMKAHEVAAIFGYSYALGLWGIPANYRSARTFAQNTDNLLKAGHTPATARDIQHRAFHTEDKIADIAANPNLSPEQKAEAIRKEEQDFCVYQQNKFNNEILSDPNLRSRLQKEGRDIRDEAEVALDVEHEADLQILKDNGILQAVIIPGQKYQVAFLEEGETKEDGTRAPGKLITQEWSRTQLTNWLMLQKNTRIEQDLRSFNSLLLAHAHAQSATPEETKTHFQNLGANRPLAALGELHKRGITPDFFRKAAEHALALQTQHENAGMSPQEAAQQPHPDFAGLSLGEVRNLSTDAATRKEQELATTGQLQSINATTDIEYGALNILRRDGTGLIKYVAGKANLLDILEERFEIDIKQRTRGNKQLSDQLAQTLLHIQSHLPGNIRLLDPAKKDRYTQSDFVEAYSKIAIGNFLLNQQNLPINPAGHRLVQNIARAVDTTRMFQTIGNAWLAYANSPEGKAHLEESGHSIADIMREAGFTFSNQIAQARATADQRTEVLQASNWQPAIEDELDALLEDIEAEEQLSEINEQEANQPTTIPAEESITGQEIVIEPDASEATTAPATTSTSEATTAPTSEATTTPATDLSGEKATTILSSMRDLIAKGKARAEHFAIVFREIPGLTEAQAIEQGIRPLTQRGEPTAAYTQGKLLAERCTDVQYLLLKSGKLPQKAKRDILGAPTQTRKNPAWPKIAKKGIAPAEQRLTIIKALQNAVDYAAENPNYNLNFTRHIISKGREYYVATDGRRLAVIERIAPKGSKDIEESLDKNGNVVKDAKFPESWRQVMIALTDKAQTLDLAPFRFLETYPKTAINHVVWQDSQGKLSKYNPNYIGKGIKFFSTLSKAIGSPSTIQVDNQSMGPILMQSDHDGWTAKYLLMPMRVVDGDIYKEGDILLSPQPSEHANFSIIGPRAKTWDKYVQDGRVFKGRDDGRLRAEIDDSKAKLITNFRNIQDLEDILVHPELFDAYPELRDITVIVKDLTNFEYPASAYRNGSIITLSSDYVRMSDADEILGTLLHEIGHYIQEKEEFLSGGNPSSARFLLKKLIQQAESKDSEYWLDVLSEKESILKEAKRLKKEIEQYEQSTPDDNSLPSKIKNQTDQLEKTVKSYNERINSKEPENGSFAATYLPSCDSYFSINLMKDELDYIIEYANVHQNDFVAFREEMQRRIKNRSTLLERYKNLESLSDEELYLRIPGEIESRNVSNRRAWNEEERTLRPFNETLEYASESLSNFSIKPITAEQAESADLFTDGVLKAENAIVTKPDVNFSIKAMHASPHEFYKFSTAFMGSGEGTQAYGWGIYFMTLAAINNYYITYFNKRKRKALFFKDKEINNFDLNYIIAQMLSEVGSNAYSAADWELLNKDGKPYGKTVKYWADIWKRDGSFEKIAKETHDKLADYTAKYTAGDSFYDLTVNKLTRHAKIAQALNKAISYREIGSPVNYRVELNADDSNLLMWDSIIDRNTVTEEMRSMIDKMTKQFKEVAFIDLYDFISSNSGTLLTPSALESIAEDCNIDEELSMPASKLVSILQPRHEKIKEQLSEAHTELSTAYNQNVDDDIKYWKKRRKQLMREHKHYRDLLDLLNGSVHGESFYRYLSRELGSDKDASLWLAKQGYKGIKFLDGNSRSAGEGTYNYVIFSGDDIKITAINRSGVWSMDEGWEEYTDPTATFSIKPAAADTLDRFTADPLGERIIHHIRTEARRYSRLLGDKTPYEQAVNAAQSAASIISAVDKYLHAPDKPVPARYRRQLQKLRSIAEKYAQIIASGTPRSFKKISPQEKQELEAAIAELEAQELDTATTESDQLLTDSDRLTKREAAARQKEHHRAIVRSAAKGRVYQTLSSMLEVTADALDSYLKHQLLQKLDRLTATVKIKRSPSKRLQGKMTAPAYRELERAINLMALSDRAYQDEIENVITAHETLALAINQGNTNLTSGNALLIQLADQLTTSGQQVTPQTLTAALANHEAALKIYGNVSSKNYEQTRLMANALFYLIRNGRNQWKAKHEAREAFIQQYLQHFLAHTPATSGTEQTARLAKEKEQKGTGFTRFANSMMNSTQLFHALSGIEALAPLMEHTKQALATAGVARDLHMKQMVEQVQASYGRILGINPATTAGYSQRQLKEISAKLDKFYEQNNQVEQTNITRHYIDADGNHQTEQLKLTKWQALDLILTYRQQHYRPNAQEHGYTDELLAQLENWCGEDLLTLGNAMQQSIPNDGTIPVYEEREGIPLRDNPLYWPAHLNIAEQETPDHPAISNPYHAAGSYRFLKGRTSNLREVAARNAYNVWKSAIAERANYVYLAPITDTLNSLLARKEFAARLKTLIGPSLYEQLKLTLKEIDGTTWAETSLQEDPHGAIARTLRNMAPALLAGNPTTLIKQSSAIANATLMPDFPPHEFAKQLIKLQQNQSGITIGQILRLDTFKARVRDNSALNDMLALGTDAKYSTYANLARSWMGLIDATDTFFNAIGATLYYNHKYEQYTKENQENGSPLTQAEIHAKCETDITVMLALTAQPLKRTDKSAFFWRNSKTLLGPLYLYMGSEMINKVGMARANWLKRKAQGMGAAKNTLHWMYQLGAGVGGVAFLTSIACAILTGNTPDDDDSLSAWLIATYLHSAFGQYTSQMPVIGQIIDLALSPYAQFIDGVADFPGVKTATAAKKLGTMITDDKTYSGAEWQTQINRLARDLNGITGYWGGVNSQTRWLTVTSSILQTFTAASNWITPIAKGATHDAFFADWLPDWYTQTDTRSPRRPKSLIEQWLTPDPEESPRRARRRSTARRTTPRKRKRQEE